MTNAQRNTVSDNGSNGSALWRIVVSEYETQLAAYATFEAKYHASCEAVGGGLSDEVRQLERDHDSEADALSQAREKLLHTPAPDAAALALKATILLEYLTECQSEDLDRVAAYASDVARLLTEAA